MYGKKGEKKKVKITSFLPLERLNLGVVYHSCSYDGYKDKTDPTPHKSIEY